MADTLTIIAEARDAALERHFDRAAELAERILASSPGCLSALRILAWAQLELDDERALATFGACIDIDPEDTLAHVGQAIWYQQHAQNDAALQAWVRAWQLDPHNQAIRRALVHLSGELPESTLADAIGLLRAGRFDEAADLLQTAEAEQPRAAALARLDALWGVGDWRQAFELASSVYARQPHSVKAVLYVAALEDRAGRTLRSRELLARAEQADPGLVLFADVVGRTGLQPTFDLHRANRGSLLGAW